MAVGDKGSFHACDDKGRERYKVYWKVDELALDFEAIEEHESNPQRLVAYAGRLKWDGCMDWGTQDAYVHFCSKRNVLSETRCLQALLEAVYDLGPKMENWQGE